MQRAAAVGADLLPDLLGVFVDEIGDAVHQRVAQPLGHRHRTPSQARAVVFGRALDLVGHVEQALGRIGPAVQHHVFDPLLQVRVEVVVDADHAGIDNAHVHAGLDRVVQKHGVDRLAHRLVAAEAEAHVRHAARNLGARQVLLDPARRVDEVDRVVVVFLDAGGDGKDVGVEDDVLGREADLVNEDLVGARADLGLAGKGVGLALLVKSHHHGGRAVAADQVGLAAELGLALLHRDRVDDALALNAAQPGLDHAPLGAVDHDRHACDLRLAGNQVQKAHHRRLAVQHGLVHVDVDHLRAVLHLLACHRERLVEIAAEDHSRKGLGAGDVGALADVDEQRPGADVDRFQARQAHRWDGSGRGGQRIHADGPDGDSRPHKAWGERRCSGRSSGRRARPGPEPGRTVKGSRPVATLLGTQHFRPARAYKASPAPRHAR